MEHDKWSCPKCNEKSYEKIYVPKKISVKFKMAKELKNKINRNESYIN